MCDEPGIAQPHSTDISAGMPPSSARTREGSIIRNICDMGNATACDRSSCVHAPRSLFGTVSYTHLTLPTILLV
eukprot:1342787-Pleurochrysis_carterae.AAC.1